MLNFQAVLLLARGDPKGYEEKEALEREVNGLESYLEAMPSLVVLAYLKRVDPEFLDRLGLFSFSRPFLQTCFTMTLFLKSGPCFILPRKGLFGGIFTWRFIAIFCLNQLSFNFKFIESQFDGKTYIANAVCVSALGAILGLVSTHRAVGSWKTVFGLLVKFPPLLFLPIFGFVTFGPTPKGEAQNSLFRCVIISGTCPSGSVGPSLTLSHLHSVGVSGPSRTVVRPWNVIYFLKGMTDSFQISICQKCL